MSVHAEAIQLEELLQSFVDRQGDAAIDDLFSQGKACCERLTAAHDGALADSVKAAVDLASSLEQFPVQSISLTEKRGEKRAIATLMASGDMPEPGRIGQELHSLVALPDTTMTDNSGDDMDAIAHAMVDELQARKHLQADLQQLQQDRDCVLRTVTNQRESVTKLASMVRDVRGKATEAFEQLDVDSLKLPQRQTMAPEGFPAPLHVLCSQFLNVNAIYDCNIQVEAVDPDPEGRSAQKVSVSVPAPAGSSLGPCTVCFEYSEDMNAVLAHSTTHPDLLSLFDPGDTGSVWPHEVNTVHLTGAMVPEIPAASRPYRWCQKLAGLELLAQPTNASGKSNDTCGRTAEGFVWRMQHLVSKMKSQQ